MTPAFQPADPARFAMALRRLDDENSTDPNREQVGAESQPRELTYALHLTDWVLRLRPDASEALRLAARSQHLCRWMIPRESYPPTRAGYLRWREELKQFHAAKAAEILREVGYGEQMVSRVQALNLKRGFPQDPESRVLEDALCLLFLERQFCELAAKTSEEKIIGALQKAWRKMTPEAQALAKALPFTPQEKAVLAKAGLP